MMMQKGTCLIWALLFALVLPAQKHRIYFKDKGEQLALLTHPEQVLSQESLLRRARQGIAVNSSDLPVDPHYLQVLGWHGLEIHFASRWFNYALVSGPLSRDIKALPFVRKVEPARRYRPVFAFAEKQLSNFDYGAGRNQIEMLNGHLLHALGFTGQGVGIAVLDGGFVGTDQASVFDSLRAQGRIRGTYNFVGGNPNVYVVGSHGTSVLSTMAANADGQLVGTAPRAHYWLLRSEDETSETPVEMDNWLAAAEYADSAGASVINSSLGYSLFDNGNDSYSYADMNGDSTLVTRAADMAARKGLAVVVSAGNEGSSSWQYITAPADGDSVLAVGAVDATGSYVGFSSRGPSYDGRVKPDVAAQGAMTAIVNANGGVQGGFGTSFSGPVVAGLTACLVQAQPSKSGYALIDQVRRSASQYFNPDNQLGYGIPDFQQALALSQPIWPLAQKRLLVFPVPFETHLWLQLEGLTGRQSAVVRLRNLSGQMVWQSRAEMIPGRPLRLDLNLPEGAYLLELECAGQRFTEKVLH